MSFSAVGNQLQEAAADIEVPEPNVAGNGREVFVGVALVAGDRGSGPDAGQKLAGQDFFACRADPQPA
jgi:hypothetical protein